MTASRSAIIVNDVQVSIVESAAGQAQLLQSLARALDAARDSDVPVIYASIGHRDGYPEVSSNNRDAMRFVKAARFLESDASTGIAGAVAPHKGDIVMVKRRVSAFTGTDLDLVLRSLGITRMVLTGISTSGSILSTLREAADRDFAVTVLSDACVDADPEVHRVLLEKVFPRQAEIETVDEWIAEIASVAGPR